MSCNKTYNHLTVKDNKDSPLNISSIINIINVI